MKNWLKLTGAAVLGSVITLAAFTTFFSNTHVVTLKEANDDRPTFVATQGGAIPMGPDFSPAAEKVTPAVVHIKSKMGMPEVRGNAPFGNNDMFREFFGDRGGQFFFGEPPRGGGESTGSGVIISADGYIVTNNHVIADAKEVEVSLHDNRTYKAKVIGTDPSTDLAVIQIKESNLPNLAFGNSDNMKVGQWVLAVGNPFNLASTVTAGVISAKGRNIRIIKDQAALESFIQTDAAVNPGNSGGALVNLNGDLIGINTAISTQTGTFMGYAFAIPSKIVEKVVEDLIKFGAVQRGFLGINITDLDGNKAKKMDLDITEGVVVDSVIADGSAASAGLKRNDVIIKVEDKNVRNVGELQEAIGRRRPGDKVKVLVQRGSKKQEFLVTLKNRKGETSPVKPETKEVVGTLGLELADLDAKELKKLDIDFGVKVNKIGPGVVRKETDMKEGFIITKVDKKPVRSVKEFNEMMKEKKDGVLVEGVYPDYPGRYFYGFGLPN